AKDSGGRENNSSIGGGLGRPIFFFAFKFHTWIIRGGGKTKSSAAPKQRLGHRFSLRINDSELQLTHCFLGMPLTACFVVSLNNCAGDRDLLFARGKLFRRGRKFDMPIRI